MSKHLNTILAAVCLAIGPAMPGAIAQAPQSPPTTPPTTPEQATPEQATPEQATPEQATPEQADPAPAYRLTTMTGDTADSTQREGRALVLMYVMPKQRGSERAIVEASQIVKRLGEHPVDLLIVTAKPDQRDYFAQFWEDEELEAQLAFDPDRELYAALKLIALPTTVVIDRAGQVIFRTPTHSSRFRIDIDGYARRAVGLLDEAGLAQQLRSKNLPLESTKSLAARHRAAARLMREKGYLDAAESELNKALELDPQSVEARLDLADLFIYSRRLDEAGRIIDEVLLIDNKQHRVQLLRGILLFRQNKLEEARTLLTGVLILNPDPARTHFYLGRIYEAQGDQGQALSHYREALGKLLDEPID
ncbi:MAG: tetratricopeptide (TPR) repeat protein [Phycisphaerales bacterium]|jgi:tetratricopeptide (TPR) repeat protein